MKGLMHLFRFQLDRLSRPKYFIAEYLKANCPHTAPLTLDPQWQNLHPIFILSDYMQGHGFATQFLLDRQKLANFHACLNDYPNINVPISESAEQLSKPAGSLLGMSTRVEFGGLHVMLHTNNLALIEQLHLADLAPPMPQISFPEVDDPLGFRFRDGGPETFWRWWLWQPYWESLTPAEQQALPIDPAWLEILLVKHR